ncbi:MAG: TldD/PmbA family protein [Janthinobacterium lividum]
MFETMRSIFKSVAPAVDFCSLRLVDERSETLAVRQNVLQPVDSFIDRGAMVTVVDKGGYGYAATSDLSAAGLREAASRARDWATKSAGHSVADFSAAYASIRGNGMAPGQACRPATASHGAAANLPQHNARRYASPGGNAVPRRSRRELIELLLAESAACRIDDRIVDWHASLWQVGTEQLFLSTDGADIEQQFHFVTPNLSVSANAGADTQTRSFGGGGLCRQGDLGIFLDSGMLGSGARLAHEALALLGAPNCPTGTMDLLLMPSQMMLQIHESIGHPLELDRILGDERNFAGTSFVTLDMFGNYRYGSPLLNVSFDPSRAEQFASYGWDDDGSRAEKQYVIRDGMLERPLGGAISQARAGMPGVAAARACSWNRPPLDRMWNLNIEAGEASLAQMIASVEHGILMDTNTSWSIDDSRNKFQFGCEYARLIDHGELGAVVKNPNYRGVSATFWRSLAAVGNQATVEVLGTPFCGKAEPSQVIRVGHASPACLFAGVDVFGAED